MDHRWDEIPIDSKRDFRVFLHPIASIADVRRQMATDGIDVSPLLTQATHSAFDAQVTLNWNYELFGTQNQPRPNQVLAIHAFQNEQFNPLWIGIVESISAYTISRGERSMQLTARTRDSLDIFRTAKRVTPLFPMMTDLGYIARRIAELVGLRPDEVMLPATAISTSHTNTQMADMSAWEMLDAVFLPAGWTPFIDGMGRLRAANRALQNIESSLVLTPDRVKRVVANRAKSPVSRVRVKWLNPILKKARRQHQKLASAEIVFGWYIPWWKKTIYFSDDETQRAEKTDFRWDRSRSANLLAGIGFKAFVKEEYHQVAENKGHIHLTNLMWAPAIVAAWGVWAASRSSVHASIMIHEHKVVSGGGGFTIPPKNPPIISDVSTGLQLALMAIMVLITNGQYEIWGMPYEWVHARNTSEAFNTAVPRWIDNPVDIETDFIMNEPHAQAVAIRELVFRAWGANKWSVELVDDYRIEFGDVIEFPDGSRMYVEDFKRTLTRDSPAILHVSGFLLGVSGAVGQVVKGPHPEETGDGLGSGTPGVPGTPPGQTPAPGTPPSSGKVCPQRSKSIPLYNGAGIVDAYAKAHPDQLNNSCQQHGGSWAFMDGCVAALRAADSRFGYNGKRGNAGDLSEDAISYYCGSGSPTHGSKDVYVIDIIGSHCGNNPGPAWINQSNDDQACGAWVESR